MGLTHRLDLAGLILQVRLRATTRRLVRGYAALLVSALMSSVKQIKNRKL